MPQYGTCEAGESQELLTLAECDKEPALTPSVLSGQALPSPGGRGDGTRLVDSGPCIPQGDGPIEYQGSRLRIRIDAEVTKPFELVTCARQRCRDAGFDEA